MNSTAQPRPQPTRTDLQAVASFSAYLEDPATRFDGAWSWNQALYDHNVIDYDYDRDSARRWLRCAATDRSFIESADLSRIRAMMTFMSRAERFCDGWIEQYTDNGVIAALCRRMGELADK